MAGPQGGLVILRVATTGDATPAIAGLTPIASAMHGGQRVTLFALRDPGLFELTVSGSGEYSLDLRIAGDVNADGKVDGADSVALDAAAAGADITGDGVVAAGDRQLVAEIGGASCRASVWQYVSILVVSVSFRTI